MLDAIIRKTYGFQKKEDRISTSQFIQLTGMSRFAVHKARRKLAGMKIITVGQKGYSQILTYSIQRDYKKWVLLPKKATVAKKGYGVYTKKAQTVGQKVTHNRKKETIQKKVTTLQPPVVKKEKIPKVFMDAVINKLVARKGWDVSQPASLTEAYRHNGKMAQILYGLTKGNIAYAEEAIVWVADKLEKDGLNWSLAAVVKQYLDWEKEGKMDESTRLYHERHGPGGTMEAQDKKELEALKRS